MARNPSDISFIQGKLRLFGRMRDMIPASA